VKRVGWRGRVQLRGQHLTMGVAQRAGGVGLDRLPRILHDDAIGGLGELAPTALAALLPEGVEMTMPGDNVVMEITLGEPIGIEPGLRFAIREGGKTVGAGVVTEVVK